MGTTGLKCACLPSPGGASARDLRAPVCGEAEVGTGRATCPKSHSQGLVGQKLRPRFSTTAVAQTGWNTEPWMWLWLWLWLFCCF